MRPYEWRNRKPLSLIEETLPAGETSVEVLPRRYEMSVVTVYEDADFQGTSAALAEGRYDWGQIGIGNDTLSSLRVPGGMTVTLYENTHFAGRSKTFTQDACYVGDDFNDITSSIVIANGSSSSSVAERMLELVNQQRTAAGLAPVSLNAQLMSSAQEHSQDMADHDFLDHTGSDGSSPFDRIGRAGYSSGFAGENIAAGEPAPENAMADWMNETPPNDGHRQNILNPNYREIGIGYAFREGTQYGHYWTQDFGG